MTDEQLLTIAYPLNSKSPPKSCIPDWWAATDNCISMK